MLVVNRFRVAAEEADSFRAELELARATLAARPGHLESRIGRNIDDPTLWVLTSTWENVGSYRRALSAYDVKMHAVPVLYRALDEPSAYEWAEPGQPLNAADVRRRLGEGDDADRSHGSLG
ncbi:antibiotic biosynthesis monooxygenase family protein [Nocardioides sp.]|uniref:antibiotic biosynthesis monooxygenase family protein n=1 Tax=Nocardioides sp. TaxID=35761 RepID=UPI002ED18D2D